MKRILLFLLASMMLLSVGCAEQGTPPSSGPIEVDGVTYDDTDTVTNFVKIVFADFGTVLVELSPSDAPLTVANFQKLVKSGFYNGLTIHRVEPGFVIQGGDPKGDGTGGSDEKIKGEFAANGVVNNLSHRRGVLSMARTNDPNSATSQFFVCLDTANCTYSLDGRYAAFGWVKSGMDVIDRIAGVEIFAVGNVHMPVNKIVITSMSFVTPNAETDDIADVTTAGESANPETGA